MSINLLFEKLKIIGRFLRFWNGAKSIDSVDSPLVYQLCLDIQSAHDAKTQFKKIEDKRAQLLMDNTLINVQSLGSQSKVNRSEIRSIRQIALSSVSPRNKCELLYGLVKTTKAKTVLELGTSLAISTAYVAAVDRVDYIKSVEDSSKIHSYNENLAHNSKINMIQSDFQSYIENELNNKAKYDCIVLDGRHDEIATISYVNQLINLLNPNGIIIVDDIYWSNGLMNAWKTLRNDYRYNLKIDLFYYGVLSNQASIKEEIDLKLWPFSKRWQLGLFR